MLFGLILIVMMIYRPEGLIPAKRRQRVMQAEKSMEQEVEDDLASTASTTAEEG